MTDRSRGNLEVSDTLPERRETAKRAAHTSWPSGALTGQSTHGGGDGDGGGHISSRP